AKMRSFNRDGSEGKMAGNSIRCVAKYLYDKGYVRSEFISVETSGGVQGSNSLKNCISTIRHCFASRGCYQLIRVICLLNYLLELL
ncbi:MAG: hypothetical protein IJB52_08840, partial [Clostridia bacterium]|nr:hypothetical protein [Clostridia bacterium]